MIENSLIDSGGGRSVRKWLTFMYAALAVKMILRRIRKFYKWSSEEGSRINHCGYPIFPLLGHIFKWVQFSHSVASNSLWSHGLRHTRLPCPSPAPRVYSNSCPSSQWCHPAISSSVVPFSSCLQSFPASGSFSNESVLLMRWPKY